MTEEGLSVVKIDAADDYTGVLWDNGELQMFGKNDRGQLGVGQGMGMDFVESVVFPQPVTDENGEVLLVKDFHCGMNNMVIKGKDDQIYLVGNRLYFSPRAKNFEKDQDDE